MSLEIRDSLDLSLLQLLLNANGPLQAQVLASYTGVSANCLRNHMQQLEEMLASHGITLKHGPKGYEVDCGITSWQGDQYSSELRTYVRRSEYLGLPSLELPLCVMIALLMERKRLTRDSLAEKFYVSRSTMNRAIEKVPELLRGYGLALDSHRGYRIQGSEWDRRVCLASSYKVYKLMSSSSQACLKRFASLFAPVSGSSDRIMKSLVESMREDGNYRCSYVYLRQILSCIMLNHTLPIRTEDLGMPNSEEVLERAAHLMPLARRIYAALPYGLGKDASQAALDSLAATLYAYEEVQDTISLGAAEHQQLQEATAFVEQVVSPAMAQFMTVEYLSRPVLDRFICAFICIRRRLLLHLPADEDRIASVRDSGVFTADICVRIAQLYERCFHERLPEAEILGLYFMVHEVRLSTRDALKLKVAISSAYGEDVTEALTHDVLRGYSKYIQSYEELSFFQISVSGMLNKYDVLITDAPKDYLPEGLPCHVVHSGVNETNDPDAEIRRYFRSRDIEKIHRDVEGRLYIVRCDVQSKEEIIDVAQDRFGTLSGHPALAEEIAARDCFLNGERMNVVIMTSMDASRGKPVIGVIINDHPLLWNRRICQVFIYYSYGSMPSDSVYGISNIIRRLLVYPLSGFQALADLSPSDFLDRLFELS